MSTNPEKAQEYLSRVNWKSLMEWLTAEAILNRPSDPVQFCRDLMGVKVAERGGLNFRPEEVTDWLRKCYTEAASLVDENGVIHGKTIEQAPQTLAEQVEDMKHKMDSMNKILDASRSMSSLDPYESTSNIVGECCRILNCDRATMFSLDTITQELLLWVAEGANNIRVPVGQGIAGTVAATGEIINIVDAYGDPRFSSSYDKATGYKTNTILCMPIRSLDGGIAGVLQAINKNDGTFSSTDEEVMNMLCMQAGVALQNANHFFRAERSQNRFRALLDLIKAVQGEVGASSLIFTITQRTTKIAEADRCTLYLADNVSKGLFAMQGEVNIRIAMDVGVAGAVATSGVVQNIKDAYESPFFNADMDKKSGFRTKAILCLPIKNGDTVVGVLQLINKIEGAGVFDEEDEEIMVTFLNIAGPIIAESALYKQMQGKTRQDDTKETVGAVTPGRKSKDSVRMLGGFAEGENEGDEEEES